MIEPDCSAVRAGSGYRIATLEQRPEFSSQVNPLNGQAFSIGAGSS
jgi:hypothetical protein